MRPGEIQYMRPAIEPVGQIGNLRGTGSPALLSKRSCPALFQADRKVSLSLHGLVPVLVIFSLLVNVFPSRGRTLSSPIVNIAPPMLLAGSLLIASARIKLIDASFFSPNPATSSATS